MLKIALTGNIASGKSAVQKIIEQLGYPILDTDIVCHKLLDDSTAVKNNFKSYDVIENGKISRSKLGKLVFANPELKKELENLLYPDLIKELNKFFSINQNEKFTFVAAPQLFEAGMENLFDRVILVYCDDDIRLKRLINRNGYDINYAKLRLASQVSQDEKISKSDYVIYNNSDLDTLKENVLKLIEQIR